MKYWNPLQKGQTIEADDVTYTPDMVLGPARKGLKVTYTTDTRPTESILKMRLAQTFLSAKGCTARMTSWRRQKAIST